MYLEFPVFGHEPGRSWLPGRENAESAASAESAALLRSERSHVDYEPILHIRLHESFVGFVDLLHRNHFDIGSDVVRAAKVEHLLGLRDTADG